ncbi:Ig-specific serine endopeptidase MIP [Metamycoplasma hyosynoviae]|uniref:Ig-specific serine endopeptidase MIP n=1 Tax=Metamycoplasma hyosynoviae TaxID=29559 RepID=UPI00235FEA80|nr:DUF31 family protein [Metamycoplasma hyosynoviae]MDD1361865.1 DUF31 family protein [Metamycoplasma hyosynoviae]MDD1371456.1 DUF31 family protein [Metamycoplasma hyosynoviae]MDD7848404.1 DUF31 family protein [Metamycoplasma hyosynoviae]MDD7893862.1 DUF31 family protein [Metamycoplasma hyosynoviae]MDD7912214.1 DUF31 family protein [Metamycoplasma hyosynoviae]
MNKTNQKILLCLAPIASMPLFAMISASCINTKKANPNDIQKTPEQKQSDLSKIVDGLKIKLTQFSPNPNDERKSIYTKNINQSNIKLSIDGKDSERVDYEIYGTISDNSDTATDSSKTGIFEIIVKIFFKKDPKKDEKGNFVLKKIIENGFRHDGIGANWSATTGLKPKTSEIDKYITNNQKERYELDNAKYVEILKRQQQGDTSYNPTLDTTEKEKFDKLAQELGLEKYDSAKVKKQSLAVKDGSETKLFINEGSESGKGPSWVDSLGRDNEFKTTGLPRQLVNDMYKTSALQTFSIRFDMKTDKPRETKGSSGTAWILDYQKNNNGQPATKFYLGTNLHVVKEFDPEKLVNVSLTRIIKNVGLNTVFRLDQFDDKIEKFSFSGDGVKEMFKTFYTATDYMKDNPADYLNSTQKAKFKDVQDFQDFAVIEVDFEKAMNLKVGVHSRNNDVTSKYSNALNLNWSVKSAGELAKAVTNDYESDTEKHVKIMKDSFLKDYSRVDFPLVKLEKKLNSLKEKLNLVPDEKEKKELQEQIKKIEEQIEKSKNLDSIYIVGWPLSIYDWVLYDDLYKYDYEKEAQQMRWSYSLWTNSDYRFFNNFNLTAEETKYGNWLSYSLGYRTFVDKPGVIDAFLGAHKLVSKLFEYKGKKYFAYGLQYAPRHYAPAGGASGSSLRTGKNELIGTYFASNEGAKTGLAVAFRSEGFNYKGMFGSYNLPQYDLINGGGHNQQSSFREELQKQHPNIKTALFPNGVDKIPEEFKFNGIIGNSNGNGR